MSLHELGRWVPGERWKGLVREGLGGGKDWRTSCQRSSTFLTVFMNKKECVRSDNAFFAVAQLSFTEMYRTSPFHSEPSCPSYIFLAR